MCCLILTSQSDLSLSLSFSLKLELYHPMATLLHWRHQEPTFSKNNHLCTTHCRRSCNSTTKNLRIILADLPQAFVEANSWTSKELYLLVQEVKLLWYWTIIITKLTSSAVYNGTEHSSFFNRLPQGADQLLFSFWTFSFTNVHNTQDSRGKGRSSL